jgi:hypothetical protein
VFYKTTLLISSEKWVQRPMLINMNLSNIVWDRMWSNKIQSLHFEVKLVVVKHSASNLLFINHLLKNIRRLLRWNKLSKRMAAWKTLVYSILILLFWVKQFILNNMKNISENTYLIDCALKIWNFKHSLHSLKIM